MATLPIDETHITPEWLGAQLAKVGVTARVASVRAERIAEGVGLMARLSRLHIRYEAPSQDAPATLIAKFPIDLPQNLQVAQLFQFYDRECSFYTELQGRTPLRIPRCYAALRDGSSSFVLLLEDFGQGRVGDQISGNRAEDTRQAVLALAVHHAAFWDKTAALEFLVDSHAPLFCQVLNVSYAGSIGPAIEAFSEHFTPELSKLARAVGERTTAMFERNYKRPLTVAHGDFRADNLFYDLPGGAAPGVIDFQISGRGFGPFDIAYHLTQSVTQDVRRAIERPLLEEYHRTLVEHGVRGFTFADLFEEYRKDALFALIYPITVCGALDLTNPRARSLGEVFLRRSLDAIVELGAADTLDA
jgi:hypothetical protein